MRDRSSRRTFVRSAGGASLVSLAGGSGLAKSRSFPASIFRSPHASLSEKRAAEELQLHIEKMTGSRMRIDVSDQLPATRAVIAVGKSVLTDQLAITPPVGEACLLRTVGETLVVAGGQARGTMYGVSVLLEKLGCRWFTPDVARIPALRAFPSLELNELHSPAFSYREVFFTEGQGREWSARNRLNGHFHLLDASVGGRIEYKPFAHSFYDLVPPDRYFDSHPEYFAYVRGKRRKELAQLCLTNEDVVSLAVQQTRNWLTENPDISIVSVSQNDGGGWCECGPCSQVIREEGGAAAGLAVRFVNRVAGQLAVSHPGRIVDMVAYQDTADAPLLARPLANVQIRLCPIDACQAHSYEACVYNRALYDRVQKWSRIAPRLIVWQYSVNFSHFLMPFPNYDSLISDIPKFRRAGISGMFIEGAVSEGGGGDDAELRSYLAARLLWNPKVSAATEIHEFLEAVYGPAAKPLQNYFDLRQHEVRKGQHLWMDQNVEAGYLTDGLLREGRALLLSASQRATGDGAQRRIARHLLSLDYVTAIRSRRCVFQGGFYGPRDPAVADSAAKKLVQAATGLGVTHLREGYPIQQQVRDWGDVAARYAGVVITNGAITNGAISATVIPELGGRIIALGRANVLRVADPGELGYPHAGGIHAGLYEGSSRQPVTVAWGGAEAAADGVVVRGATAAGHQIEVYIRFEQDAMSLRVAVTSGSEINGRLVVAVRAEFTCGGAGNAALSYLGRAQELAGDGRVILYEKELPGGEWSLASGLPQFRLMNRFRVQEVARCEAGWSRRNSNGLNVVMTLVSPEVDLGRGAKLSLTSLYALSETSRA